MRWTLKLAQLCFPIGDRKTNRGYRNIFHVGLVHAPQVMKFPFTSRYQRSKGNVREERRLDRRAVGLSFWVCIVIPNVIGMVMGLL